MIEFVAGVVLLVMAGVLFPVYRYCSQIRVVKFVDFRNIVR